MKIDADRERKLLAVLSELMEKPSTSPQDCGCQDSIEAFITPLGFTSTRLPFEDVSNLWATKSGSKPGPTLIFAGHTDVVPTGQLSSWDCDPFKANVSGDVITGRGAADMKGALAAMLIATEMFQNKYQVFHGRLGFLITSDEEAAAINGTKKVMAWLNEQDEHFDYCVVGEPSSDQSLGDVIRVGRRGSLNGKLTIKGKQGHVAYPDKASNPIHSCLTALAELSAVTWDTGNTFFPPTSFQISNFQSGTGATNVIPGDAIIDFNFRYSTESTETSLMQRTEDILKHYHLEYALQWSLSGEPFLTQDGVLITSTSAAVNKIKGYQPVLSTGGGTSDGRFIAPSGIEVVEIGLCNETIHQINECTSLSDLRDLTLIYLDIMEGILLPDNSQHVS
ncbi:MAG: succinyl-diaminopimelate desuccinylase [Gammaproteobacteria bacterium]|jgi:succinyl-diaminopimelate desuccinylase|nr:succinyl-diaminopimelate desuccinylase [Gammaproteobacteria bacterium]MBT5203993.1 succinyl-diaminopimelate desuccinylase [Gammaproteobacteria bacterium]MBT5603822.1 succinyl-diaminopimelate desuccinylase [Gammaproteobacteria bacterium]MBT6243815.1 succinyl-diaminopimelate desuccinylase [Gammaproteobacteria bacterium]